MAPRVIATLMSFYGKVSVCERNIYTDFEYINQCPHNARQEMPRRAFLRKTINGFTNEDAMNYYIHLHTFLHHKDNMQLPSEYCYVKVKSMRFPDDVSRDNEQLNCYNLLCSLFTYSNDKTDILKYAFWNFTDDMFLNFGENDHRYKYFYYLSGKMTYYETSEQKFPMSVKEYCTYHHPRSDIDLNSPDEHEPTKEQVVSSCAAQIFNDFEITTSWRLRKARVYVPKAAFLSFVEEDLPSPDSKDYFYHVYSVIKAKDGTKTPTQYCRSITEGEECSKKQKIQMEKICVGYLHSMYLDSDATTVLKDAFRNFNESHVVSRGQYDYIYRYFYYLSGNYEFYKSEIFSITPLTPWEFCQVDRNMAFNPRLIMEEERQSGEGTSSSNQQT